MFRVLSAVTVVAALSVSGCGHNEPTPTTPQPPVVSSGPAGPTSIDPGPLPAPAALTDVIARLADPAVPGAEKSALIENGRPADAATLDTFAAALRDNGFTPVTVTASDIRWSATKPGEAVADIVISGPSSGTAPTARSGGREFSFTMTFRRNGDGWQLSRETADLLLAFGS